MAEPPLQKRKHKLQKEVMKAFFLPIFFLFALAASLTTEAASNTGDTGTPYSKTTSIDEKIKDPPVNEPAKTATPTTAPQDTTHTPDPPINPRTNPSIEPQPEGTPVLTPKTSPTEPDINGPKP